MILYLASQSPRRKALLAELRLDFDTLATEVDERVLPGEAAEAYVSRLATAKAQAGLAELGEQGKGDVWVLGSDTTVAIDHHILGKPTDFEHFCQMMEQLSNRAHQVLTAVSLASHERVLTCLVTTSVEFAELTPAQQRAYWQTGEPLDKAGGYAIQGLATVFVKRIEGSYSAVVGLPLRETAQLLTEAGLTIWQGALTTV